MSAEGNKKLLYRFCAGIQDSSNFDRDYKVENLLLKCQFILILILCVFGAYK